MNDLRKTILAIVFGAVIILGIGTFLGYEMSGKSFSPLEGKLFKTSYAATSTNATGTNATGTNVARNQATGTHATTSNATSSSSSITWFALDVHSAKPGDKVMLILEATEDYKSADILFINREDKSTMFMASVKENKSGSKYVVVPDNVEEGEYEVSGIMIYRLDGEINHGVLYKAEDNNIIQDLTISKDTLPAEISSNENSGVKFQLNNATNIILICSGIAAIISVVVLMIVLSRKDKKEN